MRQDKNGFGSCCPHLHPRHKGRMVHYPKFKHCSKLSSETYNQIRRKLISEAWRQALMLCCFTHMPRSSGKVRGGVRSLVRSFHFILLFATTAQNLIDFGRVHQGKQNFQGCVLHLNPLARKGQGSHMKFSHTVHKSSLKFKTRF